MGSGTLDLVEIIRAHFEPFDAIPVATLFGACGVYVIWSSKAKARPTYIGEGNVIKRLATHVGRFGATMNGYACILNEGTDKERKRDAEIVETALLDIAGQIDQTPRFNDSGGKRKGIEKLWEDWHNVVRIRVTGHHPLRSDTKIKGTALLRLNLRMAHEGLQVDVKHPWRKNTGKTR